MRKPKFNQNTKPMKIKFILLSLLFVTQAQAQQEPLFGMFWNTFSYFNPGSSGLLHDKSASVTYRNQWTKANGAPNTLLANYNQKVEKLHGGAGINYLYDYIGITTFNKVFANYSYHLKINENSTLGIGVSAGISHLKVKENQSFLPTPGPETEFTANAGLFFKSENLEVGLSSTQINEPRFKNAGFQTTRHYFANIGYLLSIGKDFGIKPQIFYRTDIVKQAVDYNLLVIFKNNYLLGFTFRDPTTFGIMANVDIKEKFRIGYCYEFSTPNSPFFTTTHEFVLGFKIG